MADVLQAPPRMTVCPKVNKHIHYSLKKAKLHLRRLKSGYKYDGNIWRCTVCGGWHVGRKI